MGRDSNPVALPHTLEAITDNETVLFSISRVQRNPVSSLLSIPSVQLGAQSTNVTIRDFDVSDTLLPGRSPSHATSSNTVGDPTVILNRRTAPPPMSVPCALHTSISTRSAPVPISDLAELLTISRSDPLAEWKLQPYDRLHLQWHKWFVQFRSTVDSAPFNADVKLAHLETLVRDKAKTATANIAYCGSMYQEELRTLERNFGLTQSVIGTYFEKLSKYPAVKCTVQIASLATHPS